VALAYPIFSAPSICLSPCFSLLLLPPLPPLPLRPLFLLRLPPPPTPPLFPYTTLFRSLIPVAGAALTLLLARFRQVQSQVACQRSEEHTSELQSRFDLVCRLLLEKKKRSTQPDTHPRTAPQPSTTSILHT